MREDDSGPASDASSPPRRVSRRSFLAASATGAITGLAGCSSLNLTSDETGDSSGSENATVADRPDAVYYPTHVDGMLLSGVRKANGYACALTYTMPHAFWLVTGERATRAGPTADDEIHVMPVVWDAETGQRLTDLNPVLRFRDGGRVLTSDAPWPMLAQQMGFHFGDNVALPGGGTYDVTLRVGAPAARHTGALATPDSATFDFSLAYSPKELDAISYRTLDQAGERGAVEPMDMTAVPSAALPKPDALPGRLLGTGTAGDAAVVATVLDDATRFGGDDSDVYLAVSPRTPYNRYPLPMAGLDARVGGTTHDLRETIDGELGHHYGAAIGGDVEDAPVTVSVDVPPQVSRHEGYETAFLDTPRVTLGE
ncbi:hypothetical protein MBEHAL_0269 [Halarchaeum acidiphilum MH1-52-1]|uniref:DUF7350 domain-containing protein n=1 Tax=Halarchaeum acidiphilum MH1-52-1 TaxID=1261545 RepID=U3A1I5_9EURY|nr:iron transporter [Halarchaeum acidiphilum]GAD51509.1 hypothetical protein MBEHAL_0269 [Halarchaeum acidiphilum MH1-52-1]